MKLIVVNIMVPFLNEFDLEFLKLKF